MEIKVQIENEIVGSLPDISYDKFCNSKLYESGSSDIEYDNYLKNNFMIDLTDYNDQTTPDITLIVEQQYRGRVLRFKCIYDSDSDAAFNEEEYFNKAVR